MEGQNLQLRLDALEKYVNRLELRPKTMVWACLVLAFIPVLFVLTSPGRATQTSQAESEVLRVHELAIVDDNRVDRMVIGPIPDPKVMGKTWRRRSPATGIQLNDEHGNERGGLVMLGDGTVLVGFDDAFGHERAHLYLIPDRGAGLLLQDGKEVAKISLLIPSDKSGALNPKLEMTDQFGKILFAAPSQK